MASLKFTPRLANFMLDMADWTTQRDYTNVLWLERRRYWGQTTLQASTLATVKNLGNLYAAQGRLADAERMYERALAGFKEALGADHSSTLSTFNNLGLLYLKQGRLADAERMYQRALTGRENALGQSIRPPSPPLTTSGTSTEIKGVLRTPGECTSEL